MDKKLKEKFELLFNNSDCDCVSVAVLDFKKYEFHSITVDRVQGQIESSPYYDLASLTKPLTNSFICLKNNINEFNLLLNHRAGIPAWGLLPKHGWKDILLGYEVRESDTLYSDYSALRTMLEVEKKLKRPYVEMTGEYLDSEIIHWKKLSGNEPTLMNGYWKGKENRYSVHDPNAFNLNCFTSHAGLFGTVDGLARTLIEFEKNQGFIDKVVSQKNGSPQRFIWGFDTVSDPTNTLAGAGCSAHTFGHLGFTGTSFWIDPELMRGHIILSNATKYYWYNKAGLNEFRRYYGKLVWSELIE